MKALQGYRTIVLGVLVILAGQVQLLADFGLTARQVSAVGTLLGALIIGLRLITSTPVGKSPGDVAAEAQPPVIGGIV